MPEKWAQHGPLVISYRTLRRGIGHTLRLMKKIEGVVLGPTAKYLLTKKGGGSWMSFAPVQRVNQLETGELTELVDIHFNLNDKLRQDFGDMKSAMKGSYRLP